MQAQNRYAKQTLRALLAAASALTLLSSVVTSQSVGPQFIDRHSENRILVVLGEVDSGAWTASDTLTVRSIVGRMSHAATLHRFHVELLDSARQPMIGEAAWNVTLFVGAPVSDSGRDMQPIVRLSAETPDVRVPRPFGVHLDANDSLRIVATLPARDSSAPTVLRITIEYESPDQPVSRLPVLSLSSIEMPSVGADPERTGTDRAWTWQPAVSGRIVAIAGPHLVGAVALVLEDATTGEVLWSTRTQSSLPGTVSAHQGEVIRPSVVVQGGRSYRLRVIYASTSATSAGQVGGAPLAMLFPKGPSTR